MISFDFVQDQVSKPADNQQSIENLNKEQVKQGVNKIQKGSLEDTDIKHQLNLAMNL